MAIIKFDSEKADALIRDLNRISSELDSNFSKVYSNSHGKEISLTDSRLKVYAYRNKTVDVAQEDGTVIQETVREKYLKNDFVANARLYNKHVRNIYNRSNSARTKATKSIESVINSLNKIKTLISEYETEHSLKMVNSLDNAAQFDFNFLAAYGPMGRPQNYSHSFGTIVAEDVFTSLHLGVLGQRPTSIDLKRLEVFDRVLEIAKNNALTYEEQFDKVQNLLMENVLEVDKETMVDKVKLALDSMKDVTSSPDLTLDDSLKIDYLVRLGVPVVVDYEGDLAIDITNVGGFFEDAAAISGKILNDIKPEGDNLNINTNVGSTGLVNGIVAAAGVITGNNNVLKNHMGIDTDVKFDADTDKKSNNGNHFGPNRGQELYSDSNKGANNIGQAVGHSKDSVNNFEKPRNDKADTDKKLLQEELPKMKEGNIKGDGPKNNISKDVPKKEEIHNTPKTPMNDIKGAHDAKIDIVDNEKIEKPVLKEEVKPTAEDIAINQEVQSVKIQNNYKEIEVTESSENSNVSVEIEDVVEKKGAGVLAGAAGLGAISKMSGSSNAGVPQVNGMAAGELLGINTGSDPASMGLVVGNMSNSSVSTGSVTTPSSTNSAVGGESTSDRGALNNGGTANKSNSSKASANGSSTLEDKEDKQNENSYGKPNKPEENGETTKKGLLGDASIAELDAKDDKDVKVAAGVTAITAATSGGLAIFNVFPWLMLIIALIAIATYVGYRAKKKKDKEKRLAAFNAQKAQEAANATVTLEAVQNVEETVAPVTEATVATVEQENASIEQDNTPVVPEVIVSGDEFSEQPYEPSRDGVTEIGGQSTDSTK